MFNEGNNCRATIVDEVKKVFQKFKIDPEQLCGITSDGAAAMTGKIKGFTKLFMEELGVQKFELSLIIVLSIKKTFAQKFWGSKTS